MAEPLYNASGLGLPIVMTVANRAIGAPINIWNDHSDAMSQRDSGWLQLYAESNQEAVDTHILAFRLAEELSLPVMVCMDGFILTHAYERVDMPAGAGRHVPAALRAAPGAGPRPPISIGAMVGPEAFTEVKYLAHVGQLQALESIPRLAAELGEVLGREQPGLARSYRLEGAETVVVALGSVLGTIEDSVDALREQGVSIGALGIKSFRPFPLERVRELLAGAAQSLWWSGRSPSGSAESSRRTCAPLSPERRHMSDTVIAGLGGRPITTPRFRRCSSRRSPASSSR